MVCNTYVKTPTGYLNITASDTAVDSITFAKKHGEEHNPNHPVLKQCKQELEGYFTGKSRSFSVPLSSPGTAFQKKVWKTLQTIPAGEVISYGELAKKAGYPGAARAVGSAMKTNPFPIIVPCHRVLRSDKSIGEYVGGTEMKKWLLDNEK